MKLSEIEDLPTEGERGVEALGLLARELGYDTQPQQLLMGNGTSVSGITNMLEDNPGMVKAILDFVIENADAFEKLEKDEEADEDTEDGE